MELPIGKIAQAFEDKQIDAAEAVVPALDALIPFEKYAPLQYGPWHEPDAVLHVFVDSAKFAALPPDLQYLVRQVGQAAALRSIARGLHQNAPALAAMEARGAIARPWPASVLAALHQATADEIAAISDPDARRVAASSQAYKTPCREVQRRYDRGRCWRHVSHRPFRRGGSLRQAGGRSPAGRW